MFHFKIDICELRTYDLNKIIVLNGGSMTNKDDLRLLIDIAHMYYGETATQDDVAKRFNISRSLVSK